MNNTEKLKFDLRKFGLNPEDWLILQQHSTQYLILNKADPQFQLIGTLNSSGAEAIAKRDAWKKIELKQL